MFLQEDENMQENILRNSLVTHIFLSYMEAGKKQVVRVKLRFIDTRQAYFSAPPPINFVKPKRKTPAEIKVFTVDGVYKTDIFINDTQVNLTEVLFEVSVPKLWEYVQQRSSSRNRVSLPVKIKYNDGFEIETATFDIALGGIAFYSRDAISSIYKKLPAILTMELPKSMWIKNPDCKIVVETCFVRERIEEEDEEHFHQFLYSYKFVNLPKDAENTLRELLLQITD